ncbi:MAG TPA: hypothetical protein VJ302_36455 [Blastocatellia bacterium]|nr:hypothetical protein [Blastocatellia bacterium]
MNLLTKLWGEPRVYEIPVLEFLLSDAHAPIDWDRKKTVLISEAEDRTRDSRIKDAGGLPFEAFELNFKNRDADELEDFHEFWDEHDPGKAWIYLDKSRDTRLVMYFDSDIRHSGNADRSIDFSVRIKQGKGGRML